ncbi:MULTISPECIES: SDR family oxidoreductase [unclassified Prochlorococcus]|uniref:SDR family oxidoreductase n=1 Tax=unclassified Prochlorococcus TaxID=2627481 RepID=UPI000533AB38|nr:MULTISPECIES: SDR family oxidoreductase [unclassified Prochlorococcus]KGG16482.1 hypothetical protein EV06_0320 [Prochlorococcus sp. MIT 0602]KGG17043.1 hypothetical protein EV07_0473 [Prochlorococcus sp. MIT 0603]
MIQVEPTKSIWKNRRIGITGASGSLGMALSTELRSKGSFVIGLTHGSTTQTFDSAKGPNKWIQWECGEERKLEEVFKGLDVLILNHGINPGGNLDLDGLNKAIEVNALSNWRLIEYFEKALSSQTIDSTAREIWINTSEAEIQPALSPSYEISKRLIGQLVSFKNNSLTNKQKKRLIIRKIILGPFKSQLNPIGIMNANTVAGQIIQKATSISNRLIIISPNPLTYLIMPMVELLRSLYFQLFKEKE